MIWITHTAIKKVWSQFLPGLTRYLKIPAFDHYLQAVQESWKGRVCVSQSMGSTDTCLQFVPLWNFLAGLFLIKLSAWFPVMSIQLSRFTQSLSPVASATLLKLQLHSPSCCILCAVLLSVLHVNCMDMCYYTCWIIISLWLFFFRWSLHIGKQQKHGTVTQWETLQTGGPQKVQPRSVVSLSWGLVGVCHTSHHRFAGFSGM